MEHLFESGTAFVLDLSSKPDLPLFAYAVDAKGRVVQRQPIDEKGNFKFKKPEGARALYIAPQPQDMAVPQGLRELEAMNAYQPAIRLNSKDKYVKIKSIPDNLLSDWMFCFCRVRGRVEKDFCILFPDLSPNLPGEFFPLAARRRICFTRPVCNARVHVCRVKRRLWEVLPDSRIFDLRDKLVRIPEWRIPQPDPEPFATVAVRPVVRHAELAQTTTQTIAASSTAVLSPTFALELQSNNPQLLRSALQDHLYEFEALSPYLDICSWLYYKEEIMVLDVDENGRFDQFWHSCNQTENLYFWVEYLFDGNWITVYRPSLCSGTHWNYDCGQDVTLKITDRRVSGCTPVRSRFLTVNRVGTEAWLPLINPANGLVSGLDLGEDVNGRDSFGFERPFGGNLHVWGNFGSELPETATATHYQVAVRPITTPESAWTPLNDDIARGYVDEVEDDGPTGSHLEYRNFGLKDPLYDNFYRIPQYDANTQTEIPRPVGLLRRSWQRMGEYVIAAWNTNGFDPGDYELRIQLCREVGGRLQPVAVRRELFQTINNDYTATVLAPEARLYEHNSGTGQAEGFLLKLHVDNRSCTGTIDNAQAFGSAADPNCGLLYADLSGRIPMRLGFRAAHPANFGTYHFSMVRGNNQTSGLDGVDTSGVLGTLTTLGYERVDDNYSNSSLDAAPWIAAGSCSSGAAFAQTLNVQAMATDGTQRLNYLDAPEQNAAFALITECNCAD